MGKIDTTLKVHFSFLFIAKEYISQVGLANKKRSYGCNSEGHKWTGLGWMETSEVRLENASCCLNGNFWRFALEIEMESTCRIILSAWITQLSCLQLPEASTQFLVFLKHLVIRDPTI